MMNCQNCAWLLIFACFGICWSIHAQDYNDKFFTRNILSPPIPQRPFVSVWNIDTTECKRKYNVSIDLSSFDIVINPNQTRNGDKMVIFYSSQLGYYPHFSGSTPVNGGVPQLGNITAHFEKCVKDIEAFIPDKNFAGLAVIDWESWRPLWVRNGWGVAKIYQTASIAKVKKGHPDWPLENITTKAQEELESAAKAYMYGTLKLARGLRPKAQWGYYLFPDCYNYGKKGTATDYLCGNDTLNRNDEIEWLFEESSALYPSTYLGEWFKNKSTAFFYTANRVNEAKRVDANRPSNTTIPIYVYNNLVYRQTRNFLILQDVKDSSGVAAMLGASGVVLWGDYMDNSKNVCLQLSSYVDKTLGPFLKSLSDRARQCSLTLCNSHGRCYLRPGKVFSDDDVYYFYKLFLPYMSEDSQFHVACQCYAGYSGKKCQYSG